MMAYSSCKPKSCCGGTVCWAPRFKITKGNDEMFGRAVESFWSKRARRGLLPDLTTVGRWKVWQEKSKKPCRHYWLLMDSVEYEGSFTLELMIVNQKVELASRFGDFEGQRIRKKKQLGEITASALDLFVKALECIADFENYHWLCNNCKDYCKVCDLGRFKLRVHMRSDKRWCFL